MTNTLYLECNTGISGDMSVAALLDLGADKDVLMKVLDSIPAKGFEVKISRVKKAGIDCCDFAVLLDKEHENHDHDMEYLYGKADNCMCIVMMGNMNILIMEREQDTAMSIFIMKKLMSTVIATPTITNIEV